MNTLVLESTEHGDVPVDVYQKLANDRILFITDRIDDQLAAYITATLLLKDSEDPNTKITLFINSNGGDIRNVFMIYDMMQIISAPVETICIGAAGDEAALLLSAGAPGMRFITKNSKISVNQLVHDWVNYSDLTDAKKVLDLAVSDNKRMMEIFAKTCKKPIKQVMTDFNRRVFMNGTQAVKYGLVDSIVNQNKKVTNV